MLQAYGVAKAATVTLMIYVDGGLTGDQPFLTARRALGGRAAN